MELPGLSRNPLTNRAARRSLGWRLAWSLVGGCILSFLTLEAAQRLLPRAVAGFARAPVRPEEAAASAPGSGDRLPRLEPLPTPTELDRAGPKRHKGRAKRKPAALVTFAKEEPAPKEAPRPVAARPALSLVSWLKGIEAGGGLGSRFFPFMRRARAGASGAPGLASSRAPLLEEPPPEAGGDGPAPAPEPAAAGVGDRPVPLEWGEAVGSPVLVNRAEPRAGPGGAAPDLMRGSEITPEELRQIRAEDMRTLEELRMENLMLRVGGGAVIVVLWVALLLFASGVAQRLPRPWGAEVAQSEALGKAARRRRV